MGDIFPTHTCFDDALLFFEQVISKERRWLLTEPRWQAQYRVVHGICIGHDTGEPFAHAWVEFCGAMVWQAAIFEGRRGYFALQLADFYELWQVAETWVYTLREAALNNLRTGHLGPWDERLLEMCRTRGDGRVVGRMQGFAPLLVVDVHDEVQQQ